MQPEQLTFEKILRELLTPIIRDAVNDAVTRYLSFQPVPAKESAQEFLDAQKAAEYLSLARSTMYILIYKKAIPHYKTARKVYFRRSDLDAYIMKRRVELGEGM